MKIPKKEFRPEDSKFYSASKNAKSGDVITIKTEATYKETTFKDKEGHPISKMSCMIEVKGQEKEFSMNSSCESSLMDAFGDDTSKWIGQKARVFVAPTPKGDSKMILLEPLIEVEETDAPF